MGIYWAAKFEELIQSVTLDALISELLRSTVTQDAKRTELRNIRRGKREGSLSAPQQPGIRNFLQRTGPRVGADGKPYIKRGHNGQYPGHPGSSSSDTEEEDGEEQGRGQVKRRKTEKASTNYELFCLAKELLGRRQHDETHGEVRDSDQETESTDSELEPGQVGEASKPDNEGLHLAYGRARTQLKTDFVGQFRIVGLKSRIVHDVFERPVDGVGRQFFRHIIQDIRASVHAGAEGHGSVKRRGRGILIISEHNDHVHVIHDCTYSGGSCRCRFMRYITEYVTWEEQEQDSVLQSQWDRINESLDIEVEDQSQKIDIGLGEASSETIGDRGRFRAGRGDPDPTKKENKGTAVRQRDGGGAGRQLKRYARRSCPSAMFTPEHWVNLSEYVFEAPRYCHYFEVAGRAWCEGDKIRSVSLQRLLAQRKARVVEVRRDEEFVPTIFRRLACWGTDQRVDQGGLQTNTTNKKSGNKNCRLQTYLEGFVICPPTNIFYTGHWCTGPWRYYSKNHDLIKNSFHNIRQELCDMDVKRIFLKTRSLPMERLIYVGPWNALDTYYYNVKDSVNVLDGLLKFQYPDQDTRYSFVHNLYKICNRSLPKRNCMFVLGEPNSGKNFFFDCVCHSLINFGCMGNFNKYCNFPLQECVQRRIIQWNEPNFEPGSEETLKLIFGGDTCNVKVKYQGDACMLRTPIIVLSNNDCFPKNDAFSTRMFRETWVRASFLKQLRKKPHPLGVFYLFIKYKCFSMSNLEPWELDIIKDH